MKNQQENIIMEIERKGTGDGIKIIKINVADPTENLFAVVTPIKLR